MIRDNTVIRRLRREKDVTQLRVCKILGMHTSKLSEIESGDMKARKEKRELLAKYFGMTEEMLFDDEGFALIEYLP